MSDVEWSSYEDAEVSDGFGALITTAADALQQEDARLSRALSKRSEGAFRKVGHGLSYWVYETTLVYLIFRAWLEAGKHVAWDWIDRDIGDGWRHGVADDNKEERSPRTKRYDLVLFKTGATSTSNRSVVAAFEAKWWNRGNAKPLQTDLKKLSKRFPSKPCFALAFWNSRNYEDDLDDANNKCKKCELKIVGTARFSAHYWDPTKKRNREITDGYFVLGVVRLAESSPTQTYLRG